MFYICIFLTVNTYHSILAVLFYSKENSIVKKNDWRSSLLSFDTWCCTVGVLEGRQCAASGAFGCAYRPLKHLAVRGAGVAWSYRTGLWCSPICDQGFRGGGTYGTVWAGEHPGERSQRSIRCSSRGSVNKPPVWLVSSSQPQDKHRKEGMWWETESVRVVTLWVKRHGTRHMSSWWRVCVCTDLTRGLHWNSVSSWKKGAR